MEVIYDRLFNMKSLETAVVDSAFSIDHSPAFQRLVHSHQTLKTLFVSEYQEKALPVVPNAMEYINKDRKCPQIINKDYMEHTTEVLVADDNIYTENVYSDSGNFTVVAKVGTITNNARSIFLFLLRWTFHDWKIGSTGTICVIPPCWMTVSLLA